MAKSGDTFKIELKETHLNWGSHRHTNSRGTVYGEGYIPIPSHISKQFGFYNSNHSNTGLGYNEFNAVTSCNKFSFTLKSSGCSIAGNEYAKNLHGSGNLKALGDWFHHIGAVPGYIIEIKFISSTNIVLTHN